MKTAAYGAGAEQALAAFGIRTAAVNHPRQPDIGRMPDGPEHLGASRFAKMVGNDEHEEAPKSTVSRTTQRLNRMPLWGAAHSPESGGVSNNDSALRYGGV